MPAGGKLTDLAGWIFSVNPDIRRLRPEEAARVIEAGMALVPWTVNSPELWRWALDLGVDGMITNYPYALKNMLHGHVDGEGPTPTEPAPLPEVSPRR